MIIHVAKAVTYHARDMKMKSFEYQRVIKRIKGTNIKIWDLTSSDVRLPICVVPTFYPKYTYILIESEKDFNEALPYLKEYHKDWFKNWLLRTIYFGNGIIAMDKLEDVR